MAAGQGKETIVAETLLDRPDDDVVRGGLWCQDKDGILPLPCLQGRFDPLGDLPGLLLLGHGHEFMVGVEIRLDEDDVQRFSALPEGVPFDGGPDHGPEKDEDGSRQCRGPCFPVPTAE